MTDDKFPFDALQAAGYQAVAFGQKTYNGVAILSRTPARDVVRNIPGFGDEQARVIAATLDTPLGELRLINGYFVNGQEPGSEKFAYKMKWLQACTTGCRRSWRASAAGAAGRLQHGARRPRQLRPRGPARDDPPHHRGTRTLPRCWRWA
jgi:exonuclease III